MSPEPAETGLEMARKSAQKYLSGKSFDSGPVNIVCAGQASSAAKTSTVVTIASMLTILGFIVDIVDGDGQGDASQALGIGISTRPDDNLLDVTEGRYQPRLVLSDALLGREVQLPVPGDPERTELRKATLPDIRRSALNPYNVPGFGVIPDSGDDEVDARNRDWLSRLFVYPNGNSYATGTETKSYEDGILVQNTSIGVPALLAKHVAILDRHLGETGQMPHFRIWDLHGTVSHLMMGTLMLADTVFTCVTSDSKTTGTHLDELIETIGVAAEVNPKKPRLSMILPCIIEPKNQGGLEGQRMVNRLRDRHGPLVCKYVIRKATTVKEASREHEPLPMWVPDDLVTDDYWRALSWAFDNKVLG